MYSMHKILRQAFTLIELLVVIAIIGILSGLIVVAMGGITNSANVAKAQVFSNSLRNSLMMNLVSEWKLDGNANDSWSGGNNGTWNGSGGGTNTSANYRPSTECVSGQCLNFDGTDDYVDCGAGSNLNFTNTNNFTLSMWAKDTGTTVLNGSVAGLLLKDYSANGSYGIDYYPYVNQIRAGIRDSADNVLVTYNTSDRMSNWTNIVFTYATNDANGMKLFINGVQKGVASNVGFSSFSSVTHPTLGYGILGGNKIYFNGLIDDVRIFSAAVPTSLIREQYYAGLNSLLAKGGITRNEYQKELSEMALR